MNSWPSARSRRVFAALKRIGWRHDRTVGSHKIMKKEGWADYPFSFHDSEELGQRFSQRSPGRRVFSPAIFN
jgi:predicted RNA binding protein YcfA (HicA-like mRNA interferase family)